VCPYILANLHSRLAFHIGLVLRIQFFQRTTKTEAYIDPVSGLLRNS
jgi:hypothetical protein